LPVRPFFLFGWFGGPQRPHLEQVRDHFPKREVECGIGLELVILFGACSCGLLCSDFGTKSKNPHGFELFCYFDEVCGL